MKNILVRFVMDESGATVIEYGLIAFLISIGNHWCAYSHRHHPWRVYAAIGNALSVAG
jgi:hypothetical protein